jgi:hypothetical protein
MRTRWLPGLVVGLLVAGCGGSSSTSATQLRTQANRVCAATNRRALRIVRSSSAAQPERFLERGLVALRSEYRQLSAIPAPGDSGAVYSSALTALSGETATIAHTITALEHQGDPLIAFRALQARLSPLEREANSAWSSLGISACAS